MALVRLYLENQNKAKHVESELVPRLDEGSSPSSSTGRIRHKATKHRQTVQIERFERFFYCEFTIQFLRFHFIAKKSLQFLEIIYPNIK